MKPMSLEQIQRRALRTGAEVSVDGKVFNSARAQVAAAPPPPVAAVPPLPSSAITAPVAAPPPPDTLTRDQVSVMLRQQAEDFEQKFAALRSLVASGNPNESGAEREVLGFRPTYDKDERIVQLRVVYEGDSLDGPLIGI